MIKKILNHISLAFLLIFISACGATLTDPIQIQSVVDESTLKPSDYAPWDPTQVLVPGVNLLTFTEGDRETTFPNYRGNKTYPIKFKIVTGTSSAAGAVDPGFYNVKIEYSSNGGMTWSTFIGASALPVTSESDASFDWVISSTTFTSSTRYLIRVTAKNAAGKEVSVQSSKEFTVDSQAPRITSFGLTPDSLGVVTVGTSSTPTVANVVNRSFFNTSLTVSDTTTVVKYVCLKAFDAVPPIESDTCWQDLKEQASLSINLTNISTFVGFVQNTYEIRVWAQDAAGNISALNAGNGTEFVDKLTVAYNPALAPVITNVIASSNDSTSLSPTKAQTTFVVNQDLFIRWKVSDSDLVTAPISIFYSTDEVNYLPIANAQNITNDAVGCTIDGNFTGCRRIAAPSSGYFKIRIKAVDRSGLISISATPALNTSAFSIVAGNTDLGLNGSANKAIFFSNGTADVPADFGTLAVSTRGVVYFIDRKRGILVVDPVDGTQKVFIPSGPQSGDGGLAVSATTQAVKINIDYEDRLLILEPNRIRRVNSDGKIVTLIGGGNSYDVTRGISATDYKFQANSAGNSMFQVLPNGNIWFTASTAGARFVDYKIGIYKASDNKVYIMKLSGKGRNGNPDYEYTTDYVQSIGMAFNFRTSQPEYLIADICFPVPGGCGHYTANINARNGVSMGYGTHAPRSSYWVMNIFPSRKGIIHNHGAHYPFKLVKYNSSNNSWVNIIGKATQGYCPDGELASTCALSPIDFFIDRNDTYYFNDRGQIRVILPDGKVKTLFGESKSAGDGSSPLAARFNEITYLGVWGSSDTVVTGDNLEFNLREFTQGSAGVINKIAGNGTDESITFAGVLSGQRFSVDLATNSSFGNAYWGGVQGFQVDPRNGEVYAELTRNGLIVKIDKSGTADNGKWKVVVGGGGIGLLSHTANGQTGLNIGINGYAPVMAGLFAPPTSAASTIAQGAIENGQSEAYLLTMTQRWNGSCHVDPFAKIFRGSDGTIRQFMGDLTNPTCIGPIDYPLNQNLNNSTVMPLWSHQMTSAHYFKEERGVLISWHGSKRITKLSIDRNGSDQIIGAGNSSVFATLPKSINSFNYLKNSSNQYEIYYCANDGTLNKYNVSTSINTELAMPRTATNQLFFNCFGRALYFSNNKQLIYFPFKQNGLSGVGKYCIAESGVCP